MWTKLPPPIMKVLIINDIRYYWGDASSPGGTCPHLGERVLTGGDAISPGGERNLTWGRRVPASALSSWGSMPQLGNTMIREGRVLYLLAKASSLVKQMPTRGRVAPR